MQGAGGLGLPDLRGYRQGDLIVRIQVEIPQKITKRQRELLERQRRIRQRLADCYAKVQIMRWNGMRVLTQFLGGHHPGPDAAIGKLYWSEYHKVVTELAIDILGADAMVPTGRRPSSSFSTDDSGAPNSTWSWVGTFLNARAGTIYAGSSQVQRNIMGEMVLGLPKEPRG